MGDSNGPTRQLPDVFKELQQSRLEQQINSKLSVKKTSERKKKKIETLSKNREYAYRNMWNEKNSTELFNFSVKKAAVVTVCICALVLTAVSKNYILATGEKQEEKIETAKIQYEANENAINLTQIVSQNASNISAKDYVHEEREIPYETVYIEDTSLQKDEKVVKQEGINGKEAVVAVKTYENGQFVGESILERTIMEEPVKSVVHIGTSEFLKTYQVHLGDTLYVTGDTILREKANASAKEICTIPKYLDVKLLELSGDWCKISYDANQGFVKTSALTSASFTPTIVEESRIQRILTKVEENMNVNEPSGLTLADFKKVLSNNQGDTNKIFENCAEAFYNAEQKYKINVIFLAARGINESAWGTSNIAQTKNNLFGYGSYDRDPMEYSFTFESYEDGINTVAEALVKNYLHPAGTKIYDGQMASGKYYNGSTVSAVNTKYATDPEWGKKVYSYMEDLYNKLK